MSTISWFSIFSGFSAREIRSLMFDRNSVERRSKIPIGTLWIVAGGHCPADNFGCFPRSASNRSAKSNRSASSETCSWSWPTCSCSAATRRSSAPAATVAAVPGSWRLTPLSVGGFFGEQSLRKIHPLGEFRHLATQLLHRRDQLFVPLVAPGRLTVRLQLGGVGFADGPHDHQ